MALYLILGKFKYNYSRSLKYMVIRKNKNRTLII